MPINRGGSDGGGSTGNRTINRAKVGGGPAWEPLTPDDSRYVICIAQGPDQSGKTHFALSAPPPILIMTFDPANIRRGPIKHYVGKDIQMATFEIPKGLVATAELAKEAHAEAARYRDTFVQAVTGDYFRTIVSDREDTAWELFRFDEFDGKASQKAHNYTPLNAAYQAMWRMAEKNKKNLIFLEALKEKWRNEKPTGELIPAGHGKIGMLSQAYLVFEQYAPGEFSITVQRCRDNATRNGAVLTNQSISEWMIENNYPYPTDPNTGEETWHKIEFCNVMSYLIGGTPDEWK